jgi:hypothetical protein
VGQFHAIDVNNKTHDPVSGTQPISEMTHPRGGDRQRAWLDTTAQPEIQRGLPGRQPLRRCGLQRG